ncbi:hypothetical protein C8R46DRAFT_1106018 [Mycena filopes]|nr:hypothetical protein C8R46DRAFT_1106018 [Mycena filopes]
MDLPDEIISEILSPALKVSDEAFSGTLGDPTSQFMMFTESTSALLVVCKSWLRVSTPLLYNTVILRSKAQAQALAATLKENPDFGRFVKRLRVEGGFAIAMLKILQSSPNITDVFLSMDIISGDNACGLCRGLALLDPVRVTVDHISQKQLGGLRWWWRPAALSQNAKKLVEKLEECIPAWENLTVFKIPHYVVDTSLIAEALAKSPHLDTFLVSGLPDLIHDLPQGIPDYFDVVAENPCLKRIGLINAPQAIRNLFRTQSKTNEGLRKLLDLGVVAQVDAGAVVGPDAFTFAYPVQLAANPIAEDAIWGRVLYFALNLRSRLRLLLVCKLFARLVIPHLYEHPLLLSEAVVDALSSQLALKPELGRHIRFLTIRNLSPVLKDIVPHTPALIELAGVVRVTSPNMTWKEFSTLGEATGSSLQSFHGFSVLKTAAANPTVFGLFTQIREFTWASNTTFKTTPKLIPTDAFRLLVKLTVFSFDETFLNVLAQMELPALQSAVFAPGATGGKRFFDKHGAKLRELTLSVAQIADKKVAIWQNCPSLKVLGVACDHKHPTTPSCFDTEETHTQLERIIFKTPGSGFSRLRQANMTNLGALFSALKDTNSFPALRTLEHPYCVWPTTEGEIKKSQWVSWAEDLVEREGRPEMYLVGSDDVHWRPRLKYVRKTKK